QLLPRDAGARQRDGRVHAARLCGADHGERAGRRDGGHCRELSRSQRAESRKITSGWDTLERAVTAGIRRCPQTIRKSTEEQMNRLMIGTAAIATLVAAATPVSAQHGHPHLHVSDRWEDCAFLLNPALTQQAWRQFT